MHFNFRLPFVHFHKALKWVIWIFVVYDKKVIKQIRRIINWVSRRRYEEQTIIQILRVELSWLIRSLISIYLDYAYLWKFYWIDQYIDMICVITILHFTRRCLLFLWLYDCDQSQALPLMLIYSFHIGYLTTNLRARKMIIICFYRWRQTCTMRKKCLLWLKATNRNAKKLN